MSVVCGRKWTKEELIVCCHLCLDKQLKLSERIKKAMAITGRDYNSIYSRMQNFISYDEDDDRKPKFPNFDTT